MFEALSKRRGLVRRIKSLRPHFRWRRHRKASAVGA